MGWAFGHDGPPEGRTVHSSFSEHYSGLAQEGGFLSRGQSETLEVGNASGVFLSAPCPRENPSCRSNRPGLYRLYAGASLASQLWVPHLSLTVVR